jgi:hypothetical protein
MARAVHRVDGSRPLRVASTRDTLEIYTGGNGPGQVDTLRYFVNRFDAPPSLIKQINSFTPAVFARGVDSVLFLAAGGEKTAQLSVVLVCAAGQSTDTTQPRRLGFSVPVEVP